MMNMPTELEVQMEIKDMYDLVTLSNEFLGIDGDWTQIWGAIGDGLKSVLWTPKAAKLLFNNIGLIDFCASYCGFSLNSPEQDTMFSLLQDMWITRTSDILETPWTTGTQRFRSPMLNREMLDIMSNVVYRAQSLISG